ncbi:hypothetical protein ACFYRN_19030 [Streptomyces sp. NPDC005227]|uniref:hypothetical protein n=1 Tax=Streptomyces sp. NPDC005227 TaxID=3364707 RepID=UPI0036883AD9
MGWLFNRGSDSDLAKTKYEGRESASAAASRKNRAGHRNGGATRAARDGQDWEDRDLAQDRTGRDRLTLWRR